MKRLNAKGMSLIEVLTTVGILVIVVGGVLQLYIYCAMLAEQSLDMSNALGQATTKMEEIRNHTYSSIAIDYASGGAIGNTFALNPGTGMGVIYIDTSNPDLLEIEIDVTWQNENGRISGEDIDMDGAIDGGEDVNGNGKLDSTVKLITKVAER